MSTLSKVVVLPEEHELSEFYKNNPVPTHETDQVPYFHDLAKMVVEHSDSIKEFITKTVRENTDKDPHELSDEEIEDIINGVYPDSE